MKSIYLVRHAIAADPGPPYPNDEARPLTEEGVARWQQQVRGLRVMEAAVDVILTSPLLRCRQTATVLSEGLEPRAPVEVLEALRPGGRLADVLAGIGHHRTATAIALVGHEPSIGTIAAALIQAQGAIPFKRGAVCRIDVSAFPPRGAGTLAWLLPPRALRRLGG